MRDNHITKTKKLVALASVACVVVALVHSANAQNDGGDAYQPPEGMQVLTRGPVHEAFAEPVVFNPEPGPVVPKEAPPPIEEIPPNQKPEGENVQWIPGYWSWDEAQEDFLWVSGIWRDVPPGRQWVPGYWVEAKPEKGWRRVAGAWVSSEQEQVTYLPEPPKTLEVGPNVPQPNPESLWVPGIWYWGEGRYAWRPGYWLPVVADWVWVPAHYVWTPGGCLYVEGYWDRPLVQRGIVFAPVSFERPIYTQPQFAYTPTVTLVTTILTTNLFVRPASYQYYFGDYYDDRFTRNGYYPWYALQENRRGYDPVFAHMAAINTRQNPQWTRQLADVYQYRRTHADARPPRTYAALRTLTQQAKSQPADQQANITTQNVTTINNINVQNILLAQPIAQLASNDRLRPARFEQVAPERRERIVRQTRELREVSERRVREEIKEVQARPADFRLKQPRSAALPRSPIVAQARQAARTKGADEPGQGKAAEGPRATAATPPPPPQQAPPALAAQAASPADSANQASADAEKANPQKGQRPRPDQPAPVANQPDAAKPGVENQDGRRPRPGRPSPVADQPDAAKPGEVPKDAGKPDMPADRPRPDQPPTPGSSGRPGANRPMPGDSPNVPATPADQPPSTPPVPAAGDAARPGRSGRDRNNPALPGQPAPSLPDRPGMNRPETRPDVPGASLPDQPGLRRPGTPDAKSGRPGRAEPRGAGQPPLGPRPDLGTPRDGPATKPGRRLLDVPGPARPGADPLAPRPGSTPVPPGSNRPLRPGLDSSVPGVPGQPGVGGSGRPAPGATGLGQPDRPGLNPADPAKRPGLPIGRGAANRRGTNPRPVPPAASSPATTKPAEDPGAGQP